jgi:hypothetical protein
MTKFNRLEDWSIDENDKVKVAVPLTEGTVGVVVEDGKIFKRNAIKNVLSKEPFHIRCLVAELGDVRVYVRENNILITKRDVRL